eukprot:6463369-Amphidinium_carterae.2
MLVHSCYRLGTEKQDFAKTALLALSLQRTWCLQLFVLDEAARPLPSLEPRFVVVHTWKEMVQLWPRPPTQKRLPAGDNSLAWFSFAAMLSSHSEEKSTGSESCLSQSDVDDRESSIGPADSDESEAGLEEMLADIVQAESVDSAHLVTPADVAADLETDMDASMLIDDSAVQRPPDTQLSSSAARSMHAEELQVQADPALESTPQAALVPPAFYGRVQAAGALKVPGIGRLAYHDGKQSFEARCSRHSSCVLSRSALHSGRTSGRPLGMLWCWLQLECSREQHKDATYLRDALTYEKRLLARTELSLRPEGPTLLEFERPVFPGETDEPASLKGLL